MDQFKKNSEKSERKIREFELKERVAISERDSQKVMFTKRIKKISEDYIEYIKQMHT